MAIKTSQGFKITSDEAIDANLTLTKSEMKNINEDMIPDKYFTICQDDGKLYLFNKANTVDTQTGKFRVFEGGSGGGNTHIDIQNDNKYARIYEDVGGERQVRFNISSNDLALEIMSEDDTFETIFVPEKTTIQNALNDKQDKLTPGDGIDSEAFYNGELVVNAGGNTEWGNITGTLSNQTDLQEILDEKQETLVSGTNIKTINNHSILGEGNLVIEGGGEATDYGPLLNKPKINSVELIDNKTASDLKLQPEMDAITNQEIDTIIFG